ncbi:MAG: DinB family protein, partial [Burkholderiaceae bacterium]
MSSRPAVFEAAAPVSPLDALRRRYHAARRRTLALAAPLSPEDACAQSMEDASPVKWHLAHTTWFFETFVLEPMERGFAPCHPSFRVLFNSYYDGVGDRHPRAQRGLLTRPSLDEVLAYRRAVDARIGALLEAAPDAPELAALVELGVQHEQQHQELLLTDAKHLLSRNPLLPAYDPHAPEAAASAAPCRWIAFDAGIVAIGHDGDGFSFDNELPRHRQFVEPFRIASRLATNREFLAFVDAGGYRDPSFWLSEG